jgi:hypothetical protein
MIANSTDTEKAIRQMLSKNPSLRQYDTFRNGVKSLCVAYRDTPAELVAALMRQRMDIDVLEQLELLTHVMVEVPLKEPAEAKDLLDMPFRDSADAGSAKASLHMRMATPTEKGDPTTGSVAVDGSTAGDTTTKTEVLEKDPWADGVRTTRLIDWPAAILAWVTQTYAVVEDDRVLQYWLQWMSCDQEGDLEALMHSLEEAARKIAFLTRGMTDLMAWGKGGHLSLLLMHKISTSKKLAECASLLFGDGTREWTVIKDRARTHAARLRVEALSATAAPTPAFGVQQRSREGGSGDGKSKGPGAGGDGGARAETRAEAETGIKGRARQVGASGPLSAGGAAEATTPLQTASWPPTPSATTATAQATCAAPAASPRRPCWPCRSATTLRVRTQRRWLSLVPPPPTRSWTRGPPSTA